jgi:VWFA-related protein
MEEIPMRWTRHPAQSAAAVFALLSGLAPLAAQPPQPAPPPAAGFSEVADVLAVEIPVQVVRDGAPVSGLTAADFEVLEGRTRRPVTAFEVVERAPAAPGSGGSSAGSSAAAPAARRRVLLLFDLAFAAPQSVVIARQAARQLLAGGLAPGDLVAVASYSDAEGVRLLLNFTSDRRQAETAVAALGVQEVRPADPLLLLAPVALASTAPAAPGAGDDLQLVDRLQLLTRRFNTTEDLKGRVAAQLRALGRFGRALAAVPGRKQLLFFSEGFDSSLVVGTQDVAEMVQLNARGERSDSIADTENNERRFGNSLLAGEVERMTGEMRRADTVLHAVDVGGVRRQGNQPGYRSEGEDSLFGLARPTGGELVQNFSDLSAALRPVLERGGVGYVLTIQPEGGAGGPFRPLEVKVKGAGRGTRVLHRAGYGVPAPDKAAGSGASGAGGPAGPSGLERALGAGGLLLAGRTGGTIPAAVLATPFQAPGGAAEPAYVPVLIEVDGPRLLAGQQPAKAAAGQKEVLAAEIYAYAVDAAGEIRGHFAQTLGLDLAEAGPALAAGGLKYFGHLDLPPGAYSLRVLVRNAGSGAYALLEVPLTVPTFAGAVLLPPLIPEPGGRWLLTREPAAGGGPEPGERQVPYPFVLRDQPFMPAARPRLAAGQDAPVALVGYGLGGLAVQPAARLLTAEGREVAAAGLSLLDQERAGAAERWKAALHLPAELAPGEYLLEVSLTDPASGATGRSTIGVVVAPAR